MAGMKNNPLDSRRPMSAVERAEQALTDPATAPTSTGAELVDRVHQERQKRTPGRKSTKAVPLRKTQTTAYIDRDVDEASRNAEYALRSTPDAPDNYSEYVTEALRYFTAHMEQKHNGRQPFSPRPTKK